MPRYFIVTFIIIAAVFAPAVNAALSTDMDKYFSPTTAEVFYNIAHEYTRQKPIPQDIAHRGILFGRAAAELDSSINYLIPDMVTLMSNDLANDYFKFMDDLLGVYINENADMVVLKKALKYQLDRLNSRPQREAYIKNLLTEFSGKNAFFESELFTSLGLLLIEKTDYQGALQAFNSAYYKNPYNQMAFQKIDELAAEPLKKDAYLINQRYQIENDPYDLNKCVEYANSLQSVRLYSQAAEAYKYCIDLFSFLNPEENININLYRNWALSNYNSENKIKAVQIASTAREKGKYDIILESIAAKASAKTGDSSYARKTLNTIEEKIEESPENFDLRNMAWFYSFAIRDPQKAIDWANRAYSKNPDSDSAASMLAYTLAINGQFEVAETLIEDYREDQIQSLAKAIIESKTGDVEKAKQLLKDVISSNPATFMAEKATEILEEMGGEYIPSYDEGMIITSLRETFSKKIIPEFTTPKNAYDFKINLSGNEFSYASEFDASISVTNNSQNNLVINDQSIINGNFLISAEVTGDLEKKIQELISIKNQPSRAIKPQETVMIPVKIRTGELKKILQNHPQANLKINLQLFIDPVEVTKAEFTFNYTNKIRSIEPVEAEIMRNSVELTGKYLQNRLQTLSTGTLGQKIQSLKLFAGLKKEIDIMSGEEPEYSLKYADWMPDLLISALTDGLASDDWIVIIYAMANVADLHQNYEITSALSENLDHTHWPVRMMATYVLAKNQGKDFSNVLNHTAKYDTNPFVREMAISFGAQRPQENEK